MQEKLVLSHQGRVQINMSFSTRLQHLIQFWRDFPNDREFWSANIQTLINARRESNELSKQLGYSNE